jgi:Tripartite tricarboxylate transporter TctB family
MNRLAIRWRGLGPALISLAIGIVFLIWARTYPPRMNAMPQLVGWIMIVLASIDVVAQLDTPVSGVLRRVAGMDPSTANPARREPREAELATIGQALGWIAGYVALVFLAGFLAATPIYIFLYMLVHGRKSIRLSAMTAVVTTFTIWLTFEILFRYPLYPGLLFGG